MDALYPRCAASVVRKLWHAASALVLVLVATCCPGCGGCSGRTVEGVWYGALPGSGYADCRIELRKGGELAAACQAQAVAQGAAQSPEQVTILGKYQYEDERLTLQIDKISAGAELRPVQTPQNELRVNGSGNDILLREYQGQEYRWERRPE